MLGRAWGVVGSSLRGLGRRPCMLYSGRQWPCVPGRLRSDRLLAPGWIFARAHYAHGQVGGGATWGTAPSLTRAGVATREGAGSRAAFWPGGRLALGEYRRAACFSLFDFLIHTFAIFCGILLSLCPHAQPPCSKPFHLPPPPSEKLQTQPRLKLPIPLPLLL